MSQHSAAGIQEALAILSGAEKEIDEAKEWLGEAKRLIVNLAAVEGERAMTEALNEANMIAQQNLARARLEAEKEAERIIKRAEDDLEALRVKIDRSMEKAITLAVKAILGEAAL